MYLLYNVVRIINRVLDVVSLAMFIYCILTWVAPRASFTDFLGRLLEPFVAPFRPLAMKIAYKWGARIDLTYLFALIAIRIVEYLLMQIMYLFF